jgi:type II secretory pathway pseudopilin PulG
MLIVLAIIAVLVALILPAIQAARESARRASCQNNLAEIGRALINYHDTFGTFPYGGWGNQWVGIADGGVGKNQPGGWLYSLLPFIEEGDLHDLGGRLSGAAAHDAVSLRLRTPLNLFVCPSRRQCVPLPISDSFPSVRTPRPYGAVTHVARSDYAINAGTAVAITHAGPMDLEQGQNEQYWLTAASDRKLTGISHLRYGASVGRILDGTSKTYLVGEKFVEFSYYDTGESLGDNKSQYAGYSMDVFRFAGAIDRLALSQLPTAPPVEDTSKVTSGLSAHARFGSAHASGLNMVTCDGAIQFVAYDIDPEVHFRSGQRNDAGATFEELLRVYKL